jgi:hypothetical protein
MDTEEMPSETAEHAEPQDAEVFDFWVTGNPNPIELFELSFPRPPQGTWRERFDIRADVRFAYMMLKFDDVFVRIATRSARLSSTCSGCALLPHSLFGSRPLPSRNTLVVQEKQVREAGVSGAAQVQGKAGIFQGADVSASLDAKASGEAKLHIEKQGSREETVSRVVPRPHGAWDFIEPDGADGCLDGDYLTSRGQYLDAPSSDPADLPLAIVQANGDANELKVELAIEIEPKDIVFHRLKHEGNVRAPKSWFQRERINVELVARRLIELAAPVGTDPDRSRVRLKLGTSTLHGRRRPLAGKL